eukprot:GHVL01025770.1.p1 GENE.GHVL01025770.1~~GHVL01025770.1.p1  ORF type:complete len:435 (-),score=93.73 GHVL01025770.1:138-1442(-)
MALQRTGVELLWQIIALQETPYESGIILDHCRSLPEWPRTPETVRTLLAWRTNDVSFASVSVKKNSKPARQRSVMSMFGSKKSKSEESLGGTIDENMKPLEFIQNIKNINIQLIRPVQYWMSWGGAQSICSMICQILEYIYNRREMLATEAIDMLRFGIDVLTKSVSDLQNHTRKHKLLNMQSSIADLFEYIDNIQNDILLYILLPLRIITYIQLLTPQTEMDSIPNIVLSIGSLIGGCLYLFTATLAKSPNLLSENGLIEDVINTLSQCFTTLPMSGDSSVALVHTVEWLIHLKLKWKSHYTDIFRNRLWIEGFISSSQEGLPLAVPEEAFRIVNSIPTLLMRLASLDNSMNKLIIQKIQHIQPVNYQTLINCSKARHPDVFKSHTSEYLKSIFFKYQPPHRSILISDENLQKIQLSIYQLAQSDSNSTDKKK